MIRTIHFGTVEYTFGESIPFTSPKRYEIVDKIDKKLVVLCLEYPEVWNNTQFCTQAEGRELMSSNLNQLTKAHDELVRYVARFKGIELYDPNDY